MRRQKLKVRRSTAQRRLQLELLEDRALMTASPLTVSTPLEDTSQAKITGDVLAAISAMQTTGSVSSQLANGLVSWPIDPRSINQATQEIRVVADMVDLNPETLASITQTGATLAFVPDGYGVSKPTALEIWATPTELSTLEQLDSVRSLRAVEYTVARTGSVDSEGEVHMKARLARDQFSALGIDGRRTRIGVISDGADSLRDATWRASIGTDLPPTINVNTSLLGAGDEGTAMMQIIHDLAPGAQLFFAGALTEIGMESAINWMVQQDVDVIVDDLGAYGQSFFFDDFIANAVRRAVDNNITYVTAAGNDGTGSLQAVWPGGTGTRTVFEYNTTIPAPAANLLSRSTTFVLQWSDAWSFNSSNDFGIEILDPVTGNVLASSGELQTGSQRPIDDIFFTNEVATNVTVRVVSQNVTNARTLKFFTIGADIPETVAGTTRGNSIIGHPAVEQAISVAAVNAGQNSVASYSSRGGSNMLLNVAQQTFTTRESLDVAGIDGVSIVPAKNFRQTRFFGTSAAAPHVAAVAALMLDASNMSLTPAQVSTLLRFNATDIGNTGYDTAAGAGLVDAQLSVYDAFVPPFNWMPDLASQSDSGQSNSDNNTNLTTLTFTGSAPRDAYVRFFIDGTLFRELQLPTGSTTYTVTIAGVAAGFHTATATFAASSTSAGRSEPTQPLAFRVDTTAPIFNGTIDLIDAFDSGISSTDNITNIRQPVVAITGASVAASTFLRLVNSNSGQVVASYDLNGNVTLPAVVDGSWTYTLRAVDAAGNVSIGSTSLAITIDTVGPTFTPTPVLVASSDTGISSSDGITNAPMLQISVATPQYRLIVGGGNFLPGIFTSNAFHNPGEGNIPYRAIAVDVAGNMDSTALSQSLQVVVDRTRPTVAAVAVTPNPKSKALVSGSFAFSEPGILNFDIGDLQLTRNNSAILLSSAQSITFAGSTASIGSLSALTGALGSYTLSLNASTSGIVDTAGNALLTQGTVSTSWNMITFQNLNNRFDVNNDGEVSPLDALLVIEFLRVRGSGPTERTPALPPPPASFYYDVSGDTDISPLDALQVIEFLSKRAAGTSGPPAPASAPAPTGAPAPASTLPLSRTALSQQSESVAMPPTTTSPLTSLGSVLKESQFNVDLFYQELGGPTSLATDELDTLLAKLKTSSTSKLAAKIRF